MKSIKFKLVTLFLTLVLFVMISSGVFLRISIQTAEARRIEIDLMELAGFIEREIIQANVYHNLIHESISDRGFFAQRDLTVAVLDSSGLDYVGRAFSSSVVISAMIGNSAFNSWERAQDITPGLEGRISIWMSYATPVTVLETGETLIIYLRQDVASIWESIEDTTATIVLSIIIAMFLATVLGTFFANTLTQPILVLTKRSKEMANGNLGETIPVFSDDEIGQLAVSFNYMGKNLQTTLDNINIAKIQMEIVLQSITDGIVAFNLGGDLIHINLAAMNILDITNNEANYEVIKEMLEIKSIKESEITIELDEKFIRRSVSTYTNMRGELDGIVITIQDITKQTMLDNMRREFVANVSHEIRTPLTVIRSYAETLLEDEENSMKASFLETISTEVDRMTMLASDLLELSQFDNKQIKTNNSNNNLVDILSKVVEQARILADNKNQEVIFTKNIIEAPFFCDNLRISQVFINVVSNAIKYSPENTSIYVSIIKTDKYFNVTVKDQGFGIPKEDIDRIFERFYRVDKARSRDMGGTGLGLSIAKEILEIYNATISIESQINQGTEVTISFPHSLR